MKGMDARVELLPSQQPQDARLLHQRIPIERACASSC